MKLLVRQTLAQAMENVMTPKNCILFLAVVVYIVAICLFCRDKVQSIADVTAVTQLLFIPPFLVLLLFSEKTQFYEFRKVVLFKIGQIKEMDVPFGSFKFDQELNHLIQAGMAVSDSWDSQTSDNILKAVALLGHDKLRRSPTNLDPSFYENLAHDDPRMAVRSLRIGFEIVFRNVLDFGERGTYRRGESIDKVLDRLEACGGLKDTTLHLARQIFNVIDLADAGGFLIEETDARLLITEVKKIMGLYVDWINKQDKSAIF